MARKGGLLFYLEVPVHGEPACAGRGGVAEAVVEEDEVVAHVFTAPALDRRACAGG